MNVDLAKLFRSQPVGVAAVVGLITIYLYKHGQIDNQTLGTFVTLFIIPALHALAASKASEKDRNDTQNSLAQTQYASALIAQMQQFIESAAGHEIATSYLDIVQRNGGNFAVDKQLQELAKKMKDQVATHFQDQGINIGDVIGDKVVDHSVADALLKARRAIG